jgi:hypothetical protein
LFFLENDLLTRVRPARIASSLYDTGTIQKKIKVSFPSCQCKTSRPCIHPCNEGLRSVPGTVRSFLAFQNGVFLTVLGNVMVSFIIGSQGKQEQIAVQRIKDPPLNRSG